MNCVRLQPESVKMIHAMSLMWSATFNLQIINVLIRCLFHACYMFLRSAHRFHKHNVSGEMKHLCNFIRSSAFTQPPMLHLQAKYSPLQNSVRYLTSDASILYRCILFIFCIKFISQSQLCRLVVRVSGYISRSPGFISDTIRFSEK
jgi:hypothetical protein